MAILRADVDLLVEAARTGVLDASGVRLQTVALTGTMSMTRADVTQVVRALGGRVAALVSSHTDLLVVGDTGARESTAKLNMARALGVSIMTEAEFTEMVSGV